MLSALPKLTVLGGSSPFTAALIDSVAAAGERLPPRELTLYGRNEENLLAVRRYADTRLGPKGWRVSSTSDCSAALDGADIILHQIRYGGLSGREADERLAVAHGLPADETLGPGALQRAIQMAPELLKVARDIARYCPDSWVLNLTNPLSIAVAIMTSAGLGRCVGLCELPFVTARQACAFLGLPAERVEWSYSGLNHRGFIHSFLHDGQDYLPHLVRAMGRESLGGITGEEIDELQAIPLKYFSLFRKEHSAGEGRAAFLMRLGEDVFKELREVPDRAPASLSKRYLDWYPYAVVPMLAALSAGDGRVEVVNVLSDGIVIETKARVFADHTEPLRGSPGGTVGAWVERFSEHERAALAAALDPSRERIKAALSTDPLVPESSVPALTESLCQGVNDRTRGGK